LKCHAKKGQIAFLNDHTKLGRTLLNQQVTSAYEDYYQVKVQHDQHDKWIGTIIAVQAEAKNTMKAKLWKQLRQMEAIRKCTHQVR